MRIGLRLLCCAAISVVALCSFGQTQPPAKAPEAAIPEKPTVQKAVANPVVVLDTSEGEIRVELFPDKAPETVKNFLKYVDDGFYNGTIFHRVISNFMIQGGGFTKGMEKKDTRSPIKNEARSDLKNVRGTIAMARTPMPHSATAQFYINVKDNPGLNHVDNSTDGYGYAVFGKVIKGMDVVDKIKAVQTTTFGEYENVPVTPVVIKSIKRLEKIEKESEKPEATKPAAETKPSGEQKKVEASDKQPAETPAK